MDKNKKENLKFLSLVPTDEAKDIEAYQEAIEWALNENKVNNIAITGGYGSGKSSILKSVISNLETKKEFKKKIIEISLANFCHNLNESSDGDFEETLIRELEKKVLNQLFYQKSNQTIPHSRFTKISFLTDEQKKRMSFLIVVYLVFFTVDLYIFLEGNISNFFSIVFKPYIIAVKWENVPEIILELLYRFPHFIFVGINLYLFWKFSYFILGKISNLNLVKIKFNRNNIGAEAEVGKSILNNHLDELLYFFQATGYKIVIFEDLDRYNNAKIFINLREINEVINKYEAVGDVKFVYALKDSMFSEEERTKFFDFIIPILPYTTASNFVEKFEYECRQHGSSHYLEAVDSEVLKELSVYDLNMRQIKNIINETVIYYKTLDTGIDINKLIVFMFYKNMYPEDYEKFQSDKGILATILNAREELTKLKSREISDQIELYEKESSQTFAETQEELTAIIINKILRDIPDNVTSIGIMKDSYKKIGDIKFEELEEIILSKKIKYQYNSYNLDKEMPLPDKIIQEFNSKLNTVKSKQNQNNLEIEKLNQELNAVHGGLFNNLISFDRILLILKQEYLINQEFGELPEKLKNQIKFIHKFIERGYLVEQYWSYKNKFKLGKLSKADHDYIIKVMDWSYSRVDIIFKEYVINNAKEVMNALPKRCFTTVAVLNFSLVLFLLRNQTNEFLEQKEDLINVLTNESKETLLFIEEYLKFQYEGNEELITTLWKRWDELPNFIEKTSNEQLRTLLLTKIYLVLENKDYSLNSNFNILIEYTAKKSKYLFESELDNNYFNSFVEEFNIKFESIKFKNILEGKSQHDFSEKIKYLVENNRYQINSENLQEIVSQFVKNSKVNKPYYSIINQINEVDIKYIDSHISQYIEAVYTQDITLMEDETVYVELLNHLFNQEEEFSDLVATFVDNLKKSNVKITDLEEIEDNSLKIEIFSKEMMAISWENIISIFSFEKVKEKLFDYLNKKEVCDTLIQLTVPDSSSYELTVAMMESNDFSDDIYDKYIRLFSEYKWEDLDIKKLNHEKKKSLVQHCVLDYNYEYVKKIDNEQLILEFIKSNIDKFIDDIDQYDLSFINRNFDFFIGNKFLSNNQKLKIFKHLSDSNTVDFQNLNAIDAEQFAVFIYDTSTDERWDENLIKILVLNENVTDVTKIMLFNRFIAGVCDNLEFTNQFLKNMESESFNTISVLGKYPRIPKTEENEKFVEYLANEKIISSYNFINDQNLIKINNRKKSN